MTKFEEILKSMNNDVLNEDSKKAIIEAFETAVNEKTESRVKIEVETALKKLDESHAEKFEKFLEAIDNALDAVTRQQLCQPRT